MKLIRAIDIRGDVTVRIGEQCSIVGNVKALNVSYILVTA